MAEKDATTESAAEELPGFVFDHQAEIAWSEPITRGAYIARWLTVSSFLAADESTRDGMVAQIEEILDADPLTCDRDSFELPMRTAIFVYRSL